MGGIAPVIGGRFQPEVSPLATAFGFQDWSFNPDLCVASQNLTTQTIYAVGFYVYAGVTYTGVALAVSAAGTSTAPTGFFVGIASSAATGVMQTQSGNLNASASLTATGLKKFAFSAPWTPTFSGLVEVVILQNGAFAGTNVAFGRMSLLPAVWTDGTFFLAGTCGTLQTALPANAAALPAPYVTTNGEPLWVALY